MLKRAKKVVKEQVVLKSLVSKKKKYALTGDAWKTCIYLVNDVENWFGFQQVEGNDWNKFEETCAKLAQNNGLYEAQRKFNLVY